MPESLSNSPADAAPITAHNVDLSNCDREQVHLAGAIQPHGALLVLEEPALRVVQASANAAEFLRLAGPVRAGQTLAGLLGEADTAALRGLLAAQALAGVNAHLTTLARGGGRLHLFGNRVDGLLLLEFEPAEAGPPPVCDVFAGLGGAIRQLQAARMPLLPFLQLAVEQIRALTGFERVMASRFDADGSGEVIAEAKDAALQPYLGLHYPASDIPAPARRLFALSPLRHLPDVDYAPVPLLPAAPPETGGAPVDLSHSLLRSVSAMYSGYLRNMGARATLVSPLLKDGKLWGLVSCMQHSGPKHLPYERRIPVEFLTQTVSLLMGDRESLDHCGYQMRLDQALGKFAGSTVRIETLHETLAAADGLLSAVDACGVAVVADGNVTLRGQTPSERQVSMLADWLGRQEAAVFASHHLPRDCPAAAEFAGSACGLLSIRLFRASSDCLIWFRPEAVREVRWAGDPGKPVEAVAAGAEVRLLPRTSFALWKETVRGQSRHWLDCEIDYAGRLRQAIFSVIIERAKQLEQINTELERSNQELDAFAYAASHDLKEPLRGIHNFVEFLRLEDGEHLSERAHRRLATVLGLVQRMDGLLESLLQFSRVGSRELELYEQPLRLLVEQSAELIRHSVADPACVEIDLQPSLPQALRCDRARAAAVFHNLIMNAVKYNEQSVKKILVGCDAAADPPVFFVRDNGIGIDARHHELVFQLFRRLHGRDDYGGGAGAGLTIAKLAVRRHGGRIWLESLPGAGSTFYFTLAPEQPSAAGL